MNTDAILSMFLSRNNSSYYWNVIRREISYLIHIIKYIEDITDMEMDIIIVILLCSRDNNTVCVMFDVQQSIINERFRIGI